MNSPYLFHEYLDGVIEQLDFHAASVIPSAARNLARLRLWDSGKILRYALDDMLKACDDEGDTG